MRVGDRVNGIVNGTSANPEASCTFLTACIVQHEFSSKSAGGSRPADNKSAHEHLAATAKHRQQCRRKSQPLEASLWIHPLRQGLLGKPQSARGYHWPDSLVDLSVFQGLAGRAHRQHDWYAGATVVRNSASLAAIHFYVSPDVVAHVTLAGALNIYDAHTVVLQSP
jgi:hypothetical protein